jgi:hypothetical protein
MSIIFLITKLTQSYKYLKPQGIFKPMIIADVTYFSKKKLDGASFISLSWNQCQKQKKSITRELITYYFLHIL